MVIVGLPYRIPEMMETGEFRGGGPYGAGTAPYSEGNPRP